MKRRIEAEHGHAMPTFTLDGNRVYTLGFLAKRLIPGISTKEEVCAIVAVWVVGVQYRHPCSTIKDTVIHSE